VSLPSNYEEMSRLLMVIVVAVLLTRHAFGRRLSLELGNRTLSLVIQLPERRPLMPRWLHCFSCPYEDLKAHVDFHRAEAGPFLSPLALRQKQCRGHIIIFPALTLDELKNSRELIM